MGRCEGENASSTPELGQSDLEERLLTPHESLWVYRLGDTYGNTTKRFRL